jgi:hypothetical protein
VSYSEWIRNISGLWISSPHSRLITGFVTRLTRRVSLVEQEPFTLPGHLRSPPVFSGVRVARSLVLCVCFVYRFLCFCYFSFGHCVVFPSSIYRFWLPLCIIKLFYNRKYCVFNFLYQWKINHKKYLYFISREEMFQLLKNSIVKVTIDFFPFLTMHKIHVVQNNW